VWGKARVADSKANAEDRAVAAVLLLTLFHANNNRGLPLRDGDEAQLAGMLGFVEANFNDIPSPLKAIAAQACYAATASPGIPSPLVEKARVLRERAQHDIRQFFSLPSAPPEGKQQLLADEERAQLAQRLRELAASRRDLLDDEVSFLLDVLGRGDRQLAIDAGNLIGSLHKRGNRGVLASPAVQEALVKVMRVHPGQKWLFFTTADFLASVDEIEIEPVLEALLGERSPEGKVNVCMVVHFGRRAQRLELVKPMLVDSNSWVRRAAEECFEALGWRTWCGQVTERTAVVGPIVPPPAVHGAPPAKGEF